MNRSIGSRFALSGVPLIILLSIFSMSLMSDNASSASSSCDITPSSDWPDGIKPGDFFEIETLDGGEAVSYTHLTLPTKA